MNDILIRHTLAPTNCRAILILAMIAISQIVVSEEAGFRYQTIPGSSTRDYSAPSFVTKGNTTYRTIPGSSTRDYGAPSYVTKGNTTYQTMPGSSTRNYGAPSFVTKGETTYLPSVAAHPRFIPEIARRLADPTFTKRLDLTAYQLGVFVQKREQLLHEVLDGLDKDSIAALALIYMKKDYLESPISLHETEEDALRRLGSSLGKCIAALESLNGSLVLRQQADGESVWRFKHPTIGDAFASALSRSPDLLGIFLLGSATENLIEQVTCGDVGIEQAVIVPKSLYPQMIARFTEFTASEKYKSQHLAIWGAKWSLHSFLTRRCSKEFLALYLQTKPELTDKVCRPGLF